MTLAEKLRYLREVEGSLRGLGRPMTQQELVRAIRKEQGKSISQSYVSQIEGGVRPHMTQSTRTLLARFFKVHPGFLVDDPEGYHTELVSDLRTTEGKLDVWLLQGSERFASDPQVKRGPDQGGARKRTRRCFLLLGAILDTPDWPIACWKRCNPSAAETGRTARKGGDGYDLGRFLSDLFRGGIFLQPAVVSRRRSALAPASAPLLSCPGTGASRCRRTWSSCRPGHATANPATGEAGSHGQTAAHMSPFNFITLTAFLAWFGGAGYLLTRFSGVWFVTGLGLAVFSG